MGEVVKKAPEPAAKEKVVVSQEVEEQTNFIKMSKATAKKFQTFLANLGESNEVSEPTAGASNELKPPVKVPSLGETLVDPDGTPLSPAVVQKAAGNKKAQIAFDFEGR